MSRQNLPFCVLLTAWIRFWFWAVRQRRCVQAPAQLARFSVNRYRLLKKGAKSFGPR